MPRAPKDLESIVQGFPAAAKERHKPGPVDKDVGNERPSTYTVKPQVGVRPAPLQPNKLDEDLAKEAAKKFKKNKKRIQKACAALDQDGKAPPPKAGCGASCIILWYAYCKLRRNVVSIRILWAFVLYVIGNN